jgi:demethylmenaquinone methyltransferase/2-methoxy-6-polyprenyl-1,4-benzoquinol methylase
MSTADQRMREYYDRGAQGLKRIYEDFPISVHTREMLDDLTMRMAGRDVLEIAGGTGFFARIVSEVARSIVMTDVTAGMLAEARAALADRPNVSVCEADAYGLDAVPGTFGGAFGLHWFSHVPYDRHAEFLAGVNRKVSPDGMVLFADNQLMPTDEPYGRDGTRDTFENRPLADGSTYEVVKNYFDPEHLREVFSAFAHDLEIKGNPVWWWAVYRPVRCRGRQPAS